MTTIAFTFLALLAALGIGATIVAVLRDGYRRTPEQRPARWYLREHALRSCPTGQR
jgi:hypothetical protein